jgi:hypothetical protein
MVAVLRMACEARVGDEYSRLIYPRSLDVKAVQRSIAEALEARWIVGVYVCYKGLT